MKCLRLQWTDVAGCQDELYGLMILRKFIVYRWCLFWLGMLVLAIGGCYLRGFYLLGWVLLCRPYVFGRVLVCKPDRLRLFVNIVLFSLGYVWLLSLG